MEKIIADYRGRAKHWIRSAEDFTYDYENYEYDRATDRYYVLVASEDMRSCMDGALVRKRISKSRYAEAYEKAEEEIIKAEA